MSDADMDNPTYTAVKYIGKDSIYTENVTGQKFSFAKGGSVELPPEYAKELLKHTDIFAAGANYDYVKSTRNGDGVIRKLGIGVTETPLLSPDTALRVTQYHVNSNAQSSASAGVTRHGMYRMKGPFIAWRATLYHYLAAGVNYKAAISWRTSGTELYNSSGTWYSATFSGAATWLSTAGSGSGTNPNHVFATGVSDTMFLPSEAQGNRLYGRTYADAAGNTRMDFSQAINSQNTDGLLFAGAYQNGTDAIADPTAFTPTPHNSMPPMKIETFGFGDVCRVLWSGSSTVSGQGDTTSIGPVFRAETTLNLTRPDVAWSFTNLAAPGSTTQASLARAIAEMGRTYYDFACLPIYSTNNSDKATAAGLAACKVAIIQFLEACYAKGIRPVLVTFQPGTSMDAATYANCLALRLFALDLAARGLCYVIDFAGLWGDVNAASPTWKNPSQTTDGTHPNDLGAIAGRDYIVSLFSDWRPRRAA